MGDRSADLPPEKDVQAPRGEDEQERGAPVGERALLPAVRSLPAEAVVVASGTSCRHQIADLAGRRAVHLAQALAAALDGT